MDKHIVWSGELYHKTSKTVSAGSLWAVLMRESVLGPKRLELYHTYTDYTSSLPATLVLNLGDMLHVERNLDVDPSHSKSSVPSYSPRYHWDKRYLSSSIEPPRHQFTITMEKDIHVFSTRSSDESSFWVGKLNELLHGPPEQGVEYEFPVQVLPTPLSRSLALHSSHVLKVSESDVRIYDASGTVPTSFVCPLSSVEKVDHTSSHGVSLGVLSLHCSNVRGAAGGRIITVSTPSTADISRILNHRRMSAAPPPLHTLPPPLHTPPPPPTTTSSVASCNSHYMAAPSQLHSLTAFHHHHGAFSLDSELHPSSSRTFSSLSPTNVPTCGQFWHAQVSAVKSLPPADVVHLMKQRRVEESSSSSDSDEDGDEIVHMSARQLQRIKSDRRTSSDDFESVASWVRHKKDFLGRGTDGFGRVNSFPNISNQNRSQGLSKKSNRLPEEHVSSLSMSVSKVAQHRHLLRRSSSLGSNLDEDQAYLKTIASGDKKKEDAPESHNSLVFNNMYEQRARDGGSWQSSTSVANGSQDSEQQATNPSTHQYESVKEVRLKRQPLSIESNPDYDYVKDRILGVRGFPIQPHPLDQPATSYSSDEEDNYYY